jgi:hypothetical protein
MSDPEHANDPSHQNDPTCFHRGGPLLYELACHLPFSISSVTVGLILAGIICFVAPTREDHEDEHPPTHAAGMPDEPEHAHEDHAHEDHAHEDDGPAGHGHAHDGTIVLFHLFHPAHMLFSAAATAAMFRRYDRSTVKAILVGLAGAVIVCGVSDILMPHASAGLLGHQVPLHICILQHPMLIVPFAAVGVLLGLLAAEGVSASTFFSHSLHVFTSSMASIFYLVASIGQTAWFDRIGLVFLFVVLAVMIPCCVSDIVFPVLMTKNARKHYAAEGHHH